MELFTESNFEPIDGAIYTLDIETTSLFEMEDGSYHTKHIFEPIGASKPIIEGEKTWYETVFPIAQDVLEVALTTCDGVQIELKEWSVEE